MSDFFEKVKSNAYKTKDEAVKIGRQVLGKANNVVGQTKLNFAINDAENKIKDIYAEMGKKIYRNHLSQTQEYDNLEENCAQIDKLFEEINALKDKMAELKDSVKCSNCGAYNKQDSLFCSNCGMPIKDQTNDSDTDFYEAEDSTADDEEEEAPETVKKVITIKAKKPKDIDND